MRSTAKMFYGVTVFMVIITAVYTLSTKYLHDNGDLQGTEWAGVVGLALSGALTLMLAGYFHFTERRMDILPEDWEEAQVEDKAGVLGFFAPSSIWPFAMTVGVAILGFGIAFMAYWLIIAGAVWLIWATTMLNLQYGVPPEKH